MIYYVKLIMISIKYPVSTLIYLELVSEDLKGALECVHTFVEELAAAYAPYVFQTAQVTLKSTRMPLGAWNHSFVLEERSCKPLFEAFKCILFNISNQNRQIDGISYINK